MGMGEAMILPQDKIEHYRELDRAANAGYENQPWVLGHAHYHARIAEALDLCLAQNPGNVVEIGCLHGAWSVLAAEVCDKHNRRLLCIDPWPEEVYRSHPGWRNSFETFMEVMQPYIYVGASKVLREYSQSPIAVKAMQDIGPCFTFVDGSHDYPDVLEDLRNVLPITSAIVVVDDWFSGDVRKATEKALQEYPEWKMELNLFPDFGEVYLVKR